MQPNLLTPYTLFPQDLSVPFPFTCLFVHFISLFYSPRLASMFLLNDVETNRSEWPVSTFPHTPELKKTELKQLHHTHLLDGIWCGMHINFFISIWPDIFTHIYTHTRNLKSCNWKSLAWMMSPISSDSTILSDAFSLFILFFNNKLHDGSRIELSFISQTQ